jgi:hypothetical protein
MKQLRIILVLSLIFLFPGCYENSKNTLVVDAAQTPYEVLKLYWQASLQGRDDIVISIITDIPDSFYYKCELVDSEPNKSEHKLIDQKQIPKSNHENEKNIEKSRAKKTDNLTPFSKHSVKSTKFKTLYNYASLIYIQNYAFENLKIENEYTYENEARIDIEHQDKGLSKPLRKSFYLVKQENRWKLFKILDESEKGTFMDNVNYAKSRPVCVD